MRDSSRRGRATSRKKITGAELAELRRLYSAGVSPNALATQFGVSREQARRLGKGVSQRNDPAPVALPPWRVAGHRNPKAVLTDDQVREIRSLSATGSHTQREIAAMFSVSQTQICNIINLKDRKAAL